MSNSENNTICKGYYRTREAGLFKMVRLKKRSTYYQSDGYARTDSDTPTSGNGQIGDNSYEWEAPNSDKYAEFKPVGTMTNVGITFPIQSRWILKTATGEFAVYGTSYFDKTPPYSGAIYIPIENVELIAGVCEDAGISDDGWKAIDYSGDYGGYTMYVGNEILKGSYREGIAYIEPIKRGSVVRCDYIGEIGTISSTETAGDRYDITKSSTGKWIKESSSSETYIRWSSSNSPYGSNGKLIVRYNTKKNNNGKYILITRNTSGQYSDCLMLYETYKKQKKSDTTSQGNTVNSLYRNQNVEGANVLVTYENKKLVNFHELYAFTPVAQENIFNPSAFGVIDIRKDSYAIYVSNANNRKIRNAVTSLYNVYNNADLSDKNLATVSGKVVVVNKFDRGIETIKSADSESPSNRKLYTRSSDGKFIECTDYNTTSELYDLQYNNGVETYRLVSKMSDGSWKCSGDVGYTVGSNGVISEMDQYEIFAVYKPGLTVTSNGFFVVKVYSTDYSYVSAMNSDGTIRNIEVGETVTEQYQKTPYNTVKTSSEYIKNAVRPGEDHTSRGSAITKDRSPLEEYRPVIRKVVANNKDSEHLNPSKEISEKMESDNAGTQQPVNRIALLFKNYLK